VHFGTTQKAPIYSIYACAWAAFEHLHKWCRLHSYVCVVCVCVCVCVCAAFRHSRKKGVYRVHVRMCVLHFGIYTKRRLPHSNKCVRVRMRVRVRVCGLHFSIYAKRRLLHSNKCVRACVCVCVRVRMRMRVLVRVRVLHFSTTKSPLLQFLCLSVSVSMGL
jgi:hypothetical protein